jgi:thioredoxin reductase (NADPH)
VSGPAGTEEQYDVAVVGAGPAGVSAAINVTARGRSVVLLAGQAPFGRVNGPHEIANYAGFPATSGDALVAAFRRHLEEAGVPVVADKVTRIGRDGSGADDDGFVLFGAREAFHASTVVLATGVVLEASVEGEDELVGQGVSYCVTCDGRLFAGRRVACIGYSPHGEAEASELAASFGAEVTYLPQYEGAHGLAPAVVVRAGLRPSRIERTAEGVRVTLDGDGDGGAGAEESAGPAERLDVDAVFISREAVAPGTLLDGLAVDGPHLVVDAYMRTSVRGVFAAGDCTGGPYQVARAVGQGQVAALSAVRLLREREEAAGK